MEWSGVENEKNERAVQLIKLILTQKYLGDNGNGPELSVQVKRSSVRPRKRSPWLWE